MNVVQTILNKTNRWHISLLIFALLHLNLVPSRKLGFYCNDPALSHPYTGDTISWKMLLVYVAVQPLFMMLVFESLYHQKTMSHGDKRKMYLYWYREYLYSIVLNLNIVCILKHIVGEPRPHFFDTCKPKEALSCVGSEYIPTYTCGETYWLSESAKSFPSGHSALGIHCGIFIAWYIQVRIAKGVDKRNVVIHFIQACCIVFGLFCCTSRITDRRHHWWDVLVGGVIGLLTLLYAVKHLCKNFECTSKEVTKVDADEISKEEITMKTIL